MLRCAACERTSVTTSMASSSRRSAWLTVGATDFETHRPRPEAFASATGDEHFDTIKLIAHWEAELIRP